MSRCEAEKESSEDPGPSASTEKNARQETDKDCGEDVEENVGGMVPRWVGFP